MFVIKQTYNNVENMSLHGVLNFSYKKSNFTILGSSITHPVITHIRHTVDSTNNTTYLEVKYNNNSPNDIFFEIMCTDDGSGANRWKMMESVELVQETDTNVSVYSVANLVTKERNVVTNSDFTVTNCSVLTTANQITEIPNCPNSSNYVPVITGYSNTHDYRATISFTNGKWRIFSDVSQPMGISFYRLPSV